MSRVVLLLPVHDVCLVEQAERGLAFQEEASRMEHVVPPPLGQTGIERLEQVRVLATPAR
eukprot:7221616-Lingulodinium_polyedra.AAC.1